MRVPQPHYKKSHKCWYVQIRRKMYRLDPNKAIADAIWKQLIAEHFSSSDAESLGSLAGRVQDVLVEFLAWTERHRAPETLQWYQKYISGKRGFANSIPHALRIRDLRPYHVTRWLDQRYPDADNDTVAGAITAIKRAFNWAVDEGYIKESPVRRIKKPSTTGRGEEAYLSPAQWEQLITEVHKRARPGEAHSFLDYLTVMKETGCRPQEIRRVEARHLDKANRQWVFAESESKGRKEKRRVELGDLAFGICQRLALQYPEGPLFRNSDGKPWTNYALACRFKRLSDKLGFKAFPYAIRHTYATDAILNGVDIITVSRLMGHSDLKMLERIYQHVMRDKDHMKRSRDLASRRRAGDAA